jgi:CheY-like chemotaxis protein
LVLVVDDYDDSREVCAECLSVSGFGVLQAGSGAEAIQVALDAAPDLVLMDLTMPGMDGVEATRQLKANPRTRHIPVLAFTGHRQNEEARRAGCVSFIVKPCRPDRLVEEIQRALGR